MESLSNIKLDHFIHDQQGKGLKQKKVKLIGGVELVIER